AGERGLYRNIDIGADLLTASPVPAAADAVSDIIGTGADMAEPITPEGAQLLRDAEETIRGHGESWERGQEQLTDPEFYYDLRRRYVPMPWDPQGGGTGRGHRMRPTTGPRSRAGVGAPRCRGVRADVAVGPLVPGIHLELEAVGRSPHQDSLPVLHLAAQDQPGETVADLLLHQALEGTRPVQRVEALRGEPAGRGLVHVQGDAPLAQAVGDLLDLECDDAAELLAVERLEHDDVVETVEELGLEGGAHHLHHPIVLLLLGERLVLQRDGAEVRGEDEDRGAEVHGPSLAVGEAPVVEHLQQHVEHVLVRLLDLVEQHH